MSAAEWTPGQPCRVVEHDGTPRQPKPGGREYTGTVTSATGDFVHVEAESGGMTGMLSLVFYAESRWLAGVAEGKFWWRLLPVSGEAATAAGEDNSNGQRR